MSIIYKHLLWYHEHFCQDSGGFAVQFSDLFQWNQFTVVNLWCAHSTVHCSNVLSNFCWDLRPIFNYKQCSMEQKHSESCFGHNYVYKELRFCPSTEHPLNGTNFLRKGLQN